MPKYQSAPPGIADAEIATPMLYVDEHHRQRTQQTLADLVASSLTA